MDFRFPVEGWAGRAIRLEAVRSFNLILADLELAPIDPDLSFHAMVQAFEESLVLLGQPNIPENIVPPTQLGAGPCSAPGRAAPQQAQPDPPPSSAPGGSAPQQAQPDPPAQQAQLAGGLDENGH